MNFNDNHIFNQLKHNPKHPINKLMPDEALFTLLWYFVSKESYSYASGLVGTEGPNSSVTSCYRYNDQTITRFGTLSTSYNENGVAASGLSKRHCFPFRGDICLTH